MVTCRVALACTRDGVAAIVKRFRRFERPLVAAPVGQHVPHAQSGCKSLGSVVEVLRERGHMDERGLAPAAVMPNDKPTASAATGGVVSGAT